VLLILVPHLLPFRSVSAQSQIPPLPEARTINTGYLLTSPDYLDCGNDTAPIINWAYEQEVVELTNQARADNDLPPLKRVDGLDQAARYHSADLGLDDYFEHDSYDRVGVDLNFVCLWWARINNFYSSVQAENIAAGYMSPEAVVQAWLDSPGHRQNILSSYNDEIGVGYFDGNGSYYRYWTQDFGNRGDVYPLVINGEAAETTDRMVSLYVYGNWDEIRLKNNDDTWTDWHAFQNEINWTLPATNGEHRVTAEMRNEDNNTTSSDTILLTSQTMEPELGNLPSVVTFTYSLPEDEFYPVVSVQTPENIATNDDLVWEVSVQGDWFVVTPTIGATPDAFTIIPTEAVTSTLISYTGTITVTGSSATGTLCTPHVMTVNILATEGQISQVFLPLVVNPMP
jgi:uncharacterized protein YkwD